MLRNMKAIIVRHAETTENVKNQDIGHDNEALLTEHGVLQAKKLGAYLKGEKISHAYTSPQHRAVHTAREILAHHPAAKIMQVEHLREQNLGIYQSAPKHVWREFRKNSKQLFHEVKPENGESYVELQQRAKAFFSSLGQRHKDDTVLIVSHGGTLGVLLLDILGKELTEENYKAHQPKNTEFTVVEVSAAGQKIHKLNGREHLDG